MAPKEFILGYLEGKDFTSPTEIGKAYGWQTYGDHGRGYHSSWASPHCLALVKQGKLERNPKGWYRLADYESSLAEHITDLEKRVGIYSAALSKIVDVEAQAMTFQVADPSGDYLGPAFKNCIRLAKQALALGGE